MNDERLGAVLALFLPLRGAAGIDAQLPLGATSLTQPPNLFLQRRHPCQQSLNLRLLRSNHLHQPFPGSRPKIRHIGLFPRFRQMLSSRVNSTQPLQRLTFTPDRASIRSLLGAGRAPSAVEFPPSTQFPPFAARALACSDSTSPSLAAAFHLPSAALAWPSGAASGPVYARADLKKERGQAQHAA